MVQQEVDVLPIKAKLAKIIPSNDPEVWSCPLCKAKLEIAAHVFLGCDIARFIWRQPEWPLNVDAFEDYHISSWIKAILDPSKFLAISRKEIHDFQLFATVAMDLIWFTMNQVGHNSIQGDVQSLLKQIRLTINTYKQA